MLADGRRARTAASRCSATTPTQRGSAAAPELSALLVNPVAADRARIAQIKLAFVAQASRTAIADRVSITMRDDVFVRSADPNDTAPNPTCA